MASINQLKHFLLKIIKFANFDCANNCASLVQSCISHKGCSYNNYVSVRIQIFMSSHKDHYNGLKDDERHVISHLEILTA